MGLVMELFDTDLMQYYSEQQLTPLWSLSEAKLILGQVANGLKHLKELKIVHRDVKPENILVKTDENGMINVALTDFGISKHMTATQRSSQTNIGTDLWMAPEIKGDRPTYGHPADVFGFGLTAMYILTANFPLGRDVNPTKLSQWVDKCLQDREESMSNLIKGCLQYDPSNRISKIALIDHEFFLEKVHEERNPASSDSCGGSSHRFCQEQWTEKSYVYHMQHINEDDMISFLGGVKVWQLDNQVYLL